MNLKDAKLVASQGSTGEVWADGDGRFAFVPYDREFGEKLAERNGDVALFLLNSLKEWRLREGLREGGGGAGG